ncbi:hypothetical protein [Roseicyclus sp.]|uniref:hypothetical protein n=1 Tax=Roseicyclus sp. TaxID=1914329 RepID=UPI003F9FE601
MSLSTMAQELDARTPDKLISKSLLALKDRTDAAIFQALGLPQKLPGTAYMAIRSIDTAAMMTERDALSLGQPEPWGAYEHVTRLTFTPGCWQPCRAEREFLARYRVASNRISRPAA